MSVEDSENELGDGEEEEDPPCVEIMQSCLYSEVIDLHSGVLSFVTRSPAGYSPWSHKKSDD